jgi:excinuclease ABC subunit B
LVSEIEQRAKKQERVLVTTLTKRIAEDLSLFLKNKGIRAEYLHSDIKTLERGSILDKLRKGEFDVLIGINLLREGLDLPEVTLVAILDADKEGFLRSRTALIQTMGRAARNVSGKVVIYTDRLTKSITAAMEEVGRRRKYQLEYNQKHQINPRTILKPIREKLVVEDETDLKIYFSDQRLKFTDQKLSELNKDSLTPFDKKRIVAKLKLQMRHEAENLNFEFAALLRDKIKELQ